MTRALPDLPLTLALLVAAGLFTALMFRRSGYTCNHSRPMSDRDWYGAILARAGADT